MCLLFLTVTVGLLTGVPSRPVPQHPKAFWQGIAKETFEPPAGELPVRLADELISNLGSTDPELRDDLSFSILTSWIYRKKLLGPDDLRRMAATLEGNLRRGIGDRDGDGVLLRSFSALTLSIIAARDNESPFLTPDEYRQMLTAALGYLHDEQDLRSFDAQRGWMHSAAHTADLLKFLARNSRLAPPDQGRILTAMLAKNTAAASAFTQGEDERMARVAVSIVRRGDFDRDAFKAWLGAASLAAKFPEPVTTDALRAQQNVRRLLAALLVELATDERPSEGADFARTLVRDALKSVGF
jgi:hypothetical protein